MMISAHGLSCIELTAKDLQREVSVVIDPYENEVGLRFPRTLSADVVLLSHNAPESGNALAVLGTPFRVDIPGEYEVGGVFVYGISAPRKDGGAHLLFLIEAEGIRLAHLGAMDRALTDEELTTLGDVDVLFVPSGGGMVLSPSAAAEVVQAVEPRAVIPMFYGETKLNVKEKTAQAFVKALGAPQVSENGKWKVKKGQLPEEDLQIVTLF